MPLPLPLYLAVCCVLGPYNLILPSPPPPLGKKVKETLLKLSLLWQWGDSNDSKVQPSFYSFMICV